MKKLLFASIMFATVCFSSVANAQTRSLVVYFSHSGNTESIAQQIKTFTGADILEIIPEKAYPEDYQSVVDQAKAEINAGIKPAIKPCITDIARSAPNRFCSKDFLSEAAKPDKQLPK